MKMAATIPMMFLGVCERFAGQADRVAYARKVKGAWQAMSHDELRHDVECLALGLLHHGVVPGERVGIASENRIEWAITDFALTGMGAIDVPIFPTLTAEQSSYIFNDCQATCVIVSNRTQLSKIKRVWDSIPSLRLVIVMNDDIEPEERVLKFSDVIKDGQKASSAEERREKYATMAAKVRPEDLLTLIYTSGTTGAPKGVMLTHHNLMSNIAGTLQVVDISDTDVFLSYLPMCHSLERMTGFYLAFASGTQTYIAESIETVAENMREVKPSVMTSVPRLFERIKMRVEGAMAREKPLKKKIFNWALSVGGKYIEDSPSALTKMKYSIADRLVFSKIREKTGGNLRFFASGGAALNADVGRFFNKVGLTILEGYGLTETSPVLSFNREGEAELGTVGKPLPNVEIKIASDGEIIAKGPNIMKGYWNNEAATAEVFEPDGWFHTGDIGEFNERGLLVITDRKKHILVSSGGKNIAPQPIEAIMATCPLIDQVLLVGDNREYCTALFVPDRDAVDNWASAQGLTFGSWKELVSSTDLHNAVQKDVNRLQRDLAKYERVRRFHLLPSAFTVDNGMMTPTLKVKRKVVVKTYSDVIDKMYAGRNAESA